MPRRFIAFAVVAVAAGLVAAAQDRSLNTPPAGFTNLFNGKDLDGWKSNEETPGCFTIEDGAIKVANGRLTTFGLPIGLAKLLLASRKIRRLRLVTPGIKEGFRRRGLDASLDLDPARPVEPPGEAGGEDECPSLRRGRRR